MLVVTEEELEAYKLANEAEYKRLKAREKLDKITVKTNNIEYDGNETAQANMNAVGTLANWQFNKVLTESLELASTSPTASTEMKQLSSLVSSVYKGVYKDNKVNWKKVDNTIGNVQVESILEALHKVMITKSEIITGG